MAFRAFTDEQLDEAATGATTIDQIVERLGNTTRRSVIRHLERLNHKAAQLPRCERSGVPVQREKVPIEQLLTAGVERNTVNIKHRLFAAGLKQKKCETCGISEWLGRPAPLQLDHIDGDRRNNRIENLRILCANCHAQTDTFCGKNIARLRSSGGMADTQP